MDTNKEQQKRDDFCKILYELAKSQTLLGDPSERSSFYKKLEELYYNAPGETPFRHFYSDIFSVLTEIRGDNSLGDIDILAQNLAELKKGYQAINCDSDENIIDVSQNIRKLYDHVNLDVARIRYSEAGDRRISQEEALSNVRADVKSLRSNVDTIKDSVDTTKNSVDTMKDSLQNLQKEYISILGIFAAIVLAFTGGIAFSTSVFNNIHSVSIYRIIFVSLTIGLVLVNVLYGLFYYIERIVYGKDERKIRPLVVANIVIISMILATFIAWFCGVTECRDKRMVNVYNKQEVSQSNDRSDPAAKDIEGDTMQFDSGQVDNGTDSLD